MHRPEHRPAPEEAERRRIDLLEEHVDAAGPRKRRRQLGADQRADQRQHAGDRPRQHHRRGDRAPALVISDAWTKIDEPMMVPTTSAVAVGRPMRRVSMSDSFDNAASDSTRLPAGSMIRAGGMAERVPVRAIRVAVDGLRADAEVRKLGVHGHRVGRPVVSARTGVRCCYHGSAWPAGPPRRQLRTQVVATGLTNPVAFVDGSRSTTRRSMWSNSAAPSARCATARVSPAFFLDLRSADLRRRRARPARPGLPARRRRRRGASSSTSPTPTATPWSRAITRDAQGAVDPRLAVRPDVARRPALHRAAVLESQRRPPGVWSRRLSLHRPRRRRQRRRSAATTRRIPNTLLGKMLRIDVNVPDTDPRGYRVPDDNPFVDRAADRRAAPRSGRSACAIRGATASTTGRAAAPARW